MNKIKNIIKNIIKTACVMLMAVSSAPKNPMLNDWELVESPKPLSKTDLQLQELNNYLLDSEMDYGFIGTEEHRKTLARYACTTLEKMETFDKHVLDLGRIVYGDKYTISRDLLEELSKTIKTIIDNGGESNYNMLNKLTEKQPSIMSHVMECMEYIGNDWNKDNLIKHIMRWNREQSEKIGKSDAEFNTMCGDIPEKARALHCELGIDKLFKAIPQAKSDTPVSFLTFLSQCITIIKVEELAVTQIFNMFSYMLAENL